MIYDSATCGSIFDMSSISSKDGPGCRDLTSGSALLSKAIIHEQYIPGTCAPSGGTPQGEIVLSQAVTFCCLP